jgi:glutathione-regulated potassium-efflux system ancillary protein KefC
MLLGLRWQVAELIGMTLALSSTAIAMQAMNERNLTVSQMGRSAFRCCCSRISRRSRWWR